MAVKVEPRRVVEPRREVVVDVVPRRVEVVAVAKAAEEGARVV